MSEVLGLALVGTVLGCISAIVTAVGVYYLGYILYFYLGHRLADRIFDSSLVYIKNNGCGLDVDSNKKALAADLRKRLYWALAASMISAALVALFSLGVFYSANSTGNAFLYCISFGMFLGIITGPIYFYRCMESLEGEVKCTIGRLESVRPEDLVAVFEDWKGVRHEFSFVGGEDLFNRLVLDREYFVADYVWCLKIANSNDAEWENDEEETD